VYDDNSATVVLVDKIVSDTVAVIVDTVVTWGSAIDVDDTDSTTAIHTDGVVVDPVAVQCSEIEVDTNATEGDDNSAIATLPDDEAVRFTVDDDNSRTQSSVTTDYDDVEQPEVAVVVVAPTEIEIATSDVRFDNVRT
jgi:hypothetical protein